MKKRSFIIITTLLIISVIINCLLFVGFNNKSNSLNDLKSNAKKVITEYEDLESALSEANEQIKYYKYRVVAVSDNDHRYHDYNCPVLANSTIKLISINEANTNGYEQCTGCWDSTENLALVIGADVLSESDQRREDIHGIVDGQSQSYREMMEDKEGYQGENTFIIEFEKLLQ